MKNILKSILTLSLIIVFSVAVFSQSIVGKWKTIDDETNKAKSVVEIYKENGKYFGKIDKLFLEPGIEPNPKCVECEDDRKNKPIKGMVIITDMEKDGDEYEDGEILDPSTGSVYSCKMWIEDGNLQVRGYIGFSLFGRSQTWLPYK